jgi:hypothetical protein
MSAIKLSTPSSGSISLTPADTASNLTITVPAVSGTMATLTTPSFATTIGVGGATPAASGAGITFPATQSASSDANTLDDYEEGTWTPTLPNGGTIVSADVDAVYTKVGNVVTISLYFNATPTNNGASFVVGGLPFTPSKSYQSGSIGYSGVLNTSTWGLVLNRPSNEFYFHYLNSGGLVAQSVFAGSTHPMIITATYLTN